MLPLDGVRACAVLAVLLHHTPNNPFGRFHGFRGVSIFFVLSGFLITTLALREEDTTGQLNLRAFAIRRVFRIMPLFYLALIAYVLWARVFGMEGDGSLLWRYLPYYVFYCPEFPIFRHQFAVAFAQAWSLGIEEKFYLIWPALAFWWLARSQHRIGITVGLLTMTVVLTAANGVFAQMWGSYADILIGCLLALLLQKKTTYTYLRTLGRTDFACFLLVLLGVEMLNSLTRTQLGERLFATTAALVIAALVTNTGRPAALASGAALARIGAWSYAIYLTHPIVFDAIEHIFPAITRHAIVMVLLALAIDLPLCALLHMYVEKPLMALGRRIAIRVSRPSPDYSRPAVIRAVSMGNDSGEV